MGYMMPSVLPPSPSLAQWLEGGTKDAWLTGANQAEIYCNKHAIEGAFILSQLGFIFLIIKVNVCVAPEK